MAIIYETEQIYTGPRVFRSDPVKTYLKHYSNYRYLKFIFDTTKDGMERRQASKELEIANRKMSRAYSMIPSVRIVDLEAGKKEIDRPWDQEKK